jgi:hypothetical protein
MSDQFDQADRLEKHVAASSDNSGQAHLERLHTKGGHDDDRTQPSLPVVHRSFANPAPLGLLSFATGVFSAICPIEAHQTDQCDRYFLDIYIWRPGSWHCDTKRFGGSLDVLWWSVSIHLWHYGICRRKYGMLPTSWRLADHF